MVYNDTPWKNCLFVSLLIFCSYFYVQIVINKEYNFNLKYCFGEKCRNEENSRFYCK